jgi:hypothetical protein
MTKDEAIEKIERWKVYMNECIDRATTAKRAVVSWENEVVRVQKEIEQIESELL